MNEEKKEVPAYKIRIVIAGIELDPEDYVEDDGRIRMTFSLENGMPVLHVKEDE